MKNDYKTVCNKCGLKTWYETEQPCTNTIFEYCPTCGSGEFISKPVKCNGTLKVIDNSGLNEMFNSYFESGERIEVTYTDGTKERFYVGKSTGWKPCYLMIKKSNSYGGEAVFTENIKRIRGLNKYK